MIKKYIKYRSSLFYFYCTTVVILFLVNYLYGHPMASIIYSLILITFILLIYTIVDFIKFYTRLKCLRDINSQLTMDKHLLPGSENVIETEYQQMITSFYDIIRSHVETMEKAHSEQVEYYTMWVHQIKTPISAMRLALQSNSTLDHSMLLEQELFKIEQYVELALQYTKLKNISSDLVIQEYSLEDIVHQSIKKYAQLFIYKKLSVQIEEFHATVITDSKWLAFILEQLISNAVKYTNQGGIAIAFQNHTLSITDTGIGIRREDMERIFEKGYTGYNGRLDKRASGIGLYLTKKVADSLSVKIEIDSEVGKGTTASLTFVV